MSDASVIANARRQAELQARGRDLTKEVPPLGSTKESIRDKFPNITDQMLDERATFDLKDHMSRIPPTAIAQEQSRESSIDLTKMSPEELHGLAAAAEQQAATKEKI